MIVDRSPPAVPPPVATVADFTAPTLIIPSLAARDVAGVIQELIRPLQRMNHLPDFLPFYHAVLNREYLGSTAVEPGLALPHARLTELKAVSFALGRANQPISWGAKNKTSVQLVFLLAVPATDAACYLPLLSGLAQLGKNRELLSELLSAGDAGEIYALLRRVRLRRPLSAIQPIR